MSFDPKNKADKAKLYPVLKALADLDPRKTPELIMDDAVGYPVARGQDYVRNMRRGEIAATYAALIHQWLLEHYFDLAHRLAPEIFPETPEQRWHSIVNERAISDRFRLVLVPLTMGIVERESQLKPAEATIRLGQRFCFELDSETDGHAIAMQGVRGHWHNIPLGPVGEVSTPIQLGQNQLPKMPDGKLDPLTENHDEGVHEFVLITAPNDDIPTSIQSLNTWIADRANILHRITVQFVK
ncbi:hypothetical protein SAMN04488527_1292 [Aliiroseovarius crassostreae]|uniref:Uncharacterized protein n=1 Tax=Aliiroseovarius crassostreae TaxID=154981 RepID=A0A0N8IB47_9RHOB|nr:hypothetical protein [Aliiroseovarius crassostreae]KPN62099.1 hypothetical protein AKJ29_07385 [Aliiroseovarius crassostreae]SFU89014.1 hypothetical protein SAMN04488527_1292 [Aliiroseovarius crassostreae]